MKVLNVFDTAGLGAIYGKYDDNITTYQLYKLDGFHIDQYYTNVIMYENSNELLQAALRDVDNYDKIVIHDMPDLVKVFAEKHDDITMYHHGSVLRGSKGLCDDRKCKRCFVSTKDLLHYRPNAIYLPSPIDTELFNNIGIGMGGLMINRERNKDIIEKYVYNTIRNVEYRVRDNQKVRYEEMPSLLRKYSFYVDTKYDYGRPPKLLPGLSCTALQALSCGLTVYGADLKPIVGLPPRNKGKVATQFFLNALNDEYNT